MNKFSEAQIMNNKFEILRKNILAASVFSMAYEILKKHTIIKRIEHFFSDIHKCKKDGYKYKKDADEYTKHVLSFVNDFPLYRDRQHLDNILPAISENNPDDLAKTLFLFLKKGDPAKGYIPFSYEVKQKLIPEIKKRKNKFSKEKIDQIEIELKKYNEGLS